MVLKIGLIGRMGSGKTTIADEILHTFGGIRVSFAEKLKSDIINLGLTKDGRIEKPRDRALLQNYGQLRRGELSEVIHANGRMQNIDGYLYRVTTDANGTHYDLMGINHPNYWVDALLDKVSVLSMEGHNIVVDDIRRLNEATALRDNDFLLVKIECDEKIRLARLKERDGNFNPDTLENISESEVDKLPCDGVITNESPLNDVMLQLKYLITTYLLKFDNNTIK